MTDIDGKRVVDAVGGLWNVNLGYSNDAIKQAIAEQLAELPYYSAFRGTTHPRLIELGHRLVDILKPEGARRAFFTSGGSDSVESALRIARQYWKVRGQADRVKFLSLKKGYHGTHFGAPRSTVTPTSDEPTSPCCQVSSTCLRRLPTATRSTKAIRRASPNFACQRSRTKSISRALTLSLRLSQSRCKARAVSLSSRGAFIRR